MALQGGLLLISVYLVDNNDKSKIYITFIMSYIL